MSTDYAEKLYRKLQNSNGKGAGLDARDHKVMAMMRSGFGIDTLTKNRTNWHNEANCLAEMYDAGMDAPGGGETAEASAMEVGAARDACASMVQLFFITTQKLVKEAAGAVLIADKSSSPLGAAAVGGLIEQLEYLKTLAQAAAATGKRNVKNA